MAVMSRLTRIRIRYAMKEVRVVQNSLYNFTVNGTVHIMGHFKIKRQLGTENNYGFYRSIPCAERHQMEVFFFKFFYYFIQLTEIKFRGSKLISESRLNVKNVKF